MSNWKYYEDVDFSDQNIARYNIDTRDFYCATQTKEEVIRGNVILDTTAIDKYPADKYYHTEQEVKDLIKHFWKESGEDGDWRMLSLISQNKHATDWRLKYIRILRTEKGFLVCNNYDYILSKATLSDPIDKKYLNHIADKMYKR